MMVTVQQAGVLAYWPPSHLLPFQASCGPVVPCQWHTTSTLTSANVASASAFVPVQQPQIPPVAASTIDPEQPIGYGSFGVVW